MNEKPIELFHEWLTKATESEVSNPEAFALATVDAEGHPGVRMLLLKGADARGFTFYTNLNSNKGCALRANPRAEMCFHWKSLDRQIRVHGSILAVSDEEADAYFASRARTSQLGAWASHQSHTMSDRFELEREVAKYALRFGAGKIPRPEWWSGFRLVPKRIEFWEELPFRLHRRRRCERTEDGGWEWGWLFP